MSKKPEITSFNEELVSFDVEDLSVEMLEHRFELAAGVLFAKIVACASYCQSLTCGDVDCGNLICGRLAIG